MAARQNQDGYGEYSGSCDYNNGYNYAALNDQQWNGSGKHYFVMRTKSNKPITIGPKYFFAEMHEEDGDDNQGTGESGDNVEEPNSKCRCTEPTSQVTIANKYKHGRGVTNNIKSTKLTDRWTRSDDDHNNTTSQSQRRQTTTNHDNSRTHTNCHTHST